MSSIRLLLHIIFQTKTIVYKLINKKVVVKITKDILILDHRTFIKSEIIKYYNKLIKRFLPLEKLDCKMDSDSEYNEQIRLKHYRSLQARKQQTNQENTSKNKEQKKKVTENSFVSNKSDFNTNKSSIKQEESNNCRSRPLDDPYTQQLNKIRKRGFYITSASSEIEEKDNAKPPPKLPTIYNGSDVTIRRFNKAYAAWKKKHQVNEAAANDLLKLIGIILPKPNFLKEILDKEPKIYCKQLIFNVDNK